MTEGIDAEGKSVSINVNLLVWANVYCLSSVAMLVINKLAIRDFPHPYTLSLFQNTVAVLLALLHSPRVLSELEMRRCLLWLPASLAFVAMLVSSLQALAYVSIPTVIVMKSITSLAVCYAEARFLRHQVSLRTVASLMVIVIGSVIYGLGEVNFSKVGYLWLTVNVCSSGFYFLYVKWVVRLLEIQPNVMVVFNNVLSLPLLIVFVLCLRDFSGVIPQLRTADWRLHICLFFSALVGYGISLSGFHVQTQVAATSMLVLNNMNKITTLFVSYFIFKDQFTFTLIIGLAISLLGGYLYSADRLQMQLTSTKHKLHQTDGQSYGAIEQTEKGPEAS